MKQYHEMLKHVLDKGIEREDRTGTGTIGVFGYQNRYDLSKGFPLVTTKKTSLRIIFEELKWFLNGDTNIKYLLDKNVNIWNEDAYRDYKEKQQQQGKECLAYEEFIGLAKVSGYDLGNIYGKQFRSWNIPEDYQSHFKFDIDQIADVIQSVKNNPYSRRHIVTAWNPGELNEMALPPCHAMMQFYVANDRKLSCQLYQRSADLFLGVPFNIASYALLIHMIAHVTDSEVGEFVHTFGDAHIYLNHIEQVKEQLQREPRELPQLKIKRKVDSIDDFNWEDFDLIDYNPHPSIKGVVSVGL